MPPIRDAERAMIFIDGSNLYHSLKSRLGRTNIDLGRFCEKLCGRRRLVRIYYYNALVDSHYEPERHQDQQRFLRSLESIPYLEVKLGRLVYVGWPQVPPFEKGIDVQLATDMVAHAYRGNYDTAILVASDNDYSGALQAVKDTGKNVEVVLFGQGQSSRELRRVADKIIAIDGRFLRGCWR